MKRTFICILLSAAAAMLMAGGPVYVCDFEDAAEREQWVLNPAANAQRKAELNNLWYIGEPGNYSASGHYGLYVSADGGGTSDYNAEKAMWVMAYRALTLGKGKYNLYFDWQALGKPTGSDALYLFWIPDADGRTLNSGNGAGLPAYLKDYQIDSIPLTQAMSWQYATRQFESDGKPAKLVIVWFNGAGEHYSPSGCVDNIEIHEFNDCKQPSGISHTSRAGVVTLSWNGSADYYTVRSYDANEQKWHFYEHVTEKSLEIHNMSEGVQTFYIRSHCGEDMSAYAVYTPFIVFEGVRCIDYMTLNKRNCLTTTLPSKTYSNNYVDNGYASIVSRHTIHYMQNEYDPRTNYKLKTIPPGELASVRLGNWDINNETERIEYKLHVEEGESDILKIKYAIVMNTPAQYHPEVQQAHFSLDILVNNTQLDKECSSADFSCGYGDMTGWSEEIISDNEHVLWKEWTEISVSLRNYIGQDITIRLTTTDCAQGGHYGYAYFTLGCESGELQGLTCGEANTQFTAPDNFEYRWYRADNPGSILSRKQTFNIEPTDTFLYICDVINPIKPSEDKECYYQLEAIGLPRFPVAQAAYTDVPVNCEHLVTFENRSYVRMHNDQRSVNQDIVTAQKLEDFVWDFGDGTVLASADRYVKHTYPTAGGQYTVKLYAYMGNRKCEDSLLIGLDLKDISIQEYVFNKHLCEGQQFTYNGKTYFNTFSDTTHYTVGGGCDSVAVFNLYVHDLQTSYVKDTLCARDLPYQFFNGKETVPITASGTYTGRWPHRYSEDCSCDSIAEVEFYVEPRLEVALPDTAFVCPSAGLSAAIDVVLQSGRMDSISILPDAAAQQAGLEAQYRFAKDEDVIIPLPEGIRAGHYTAVVQFLTPFCVAEERTVVLEVGYPVQILGRKEGNGWIGVLGDAAKEYGFTGYQWYRDGLPVAGANQAYIPVDNSDAGHSYYVSLLREGETTGIRSCPIVADGATAEKVLKASDCLNKVVYEGCLYIRKGERWYNVVGQEVNLNVLQEL